MDDEEEEGRDCEKGVMGEEEEDREAMLDVMDEEQPAAAAHGEAITYYGPSASQGFDRRQTSSGDEGE